MSQPGDPESTPEEPVDGGNRAAPDGGRTPEDADEPVGDLDDEERADPGGDSDVDPAPEGEER